MLNVPRLTQIIYDGLFLSHLKLFKLRHTSRHRLQIIYDGQLSVGCRSLPLSTWAHPVSVLLSGRVAVDAVKEAVALSLGVGEVAVS
jgi:hypothetical protein